MEIEEQGIYKADVIPMQLKAANDFITAIHAESIIDFWQLLADVDQMALFLMFDSIRQSPMNDYKDFADFLSAARDEQRIHYPKEYTQSISMTARYRSDGEVYLFFVKDVPVRMHFIGGFADDQVRPIKLALHGRFDPQTREYITCWKVRVIENDYKTELTRRS